MPKPPPPPTTAPPCGWGWCRRSDDDQPRLCLPPSSPTAPHAAGHGGQLPAVGGERFPIYQHTLSGLRRALPTSQWSWAVCQAALGKLDCRTVSPLTAPGRFSGAGLAGAAVGRSPSAPFCLRGPAQVCRALLVCRLLGWSGGGSQVARGCDGRGDTRPAAASQPTSSNPAGSFEAGG